MKIDINGVSITLTQDQLEEIARQTSKVRSYKDIKSFEIACEHLGMSVCAFNEKLGGLTNAEIALRKLKIIVKAIRSFTNWKPNFSDRNQKKWYNWFDLEKGFVYCDSDYYYTHTRVPSALYIEDSKQAEFLGNTFLDLFRTYLMEE